MAENGIGQIPESEFDVGSVDKDNIFAFKTLLLPGVANAICEDEPVTALGLVDRGVAVGAMAGYADGDTFVLSSFYVAPAYRKRGGGQQLLDELMEVLYGEVSQIRIGFTVTLPEHEELERFLKNRGFEDIVRDSNSMFRISLSALLENKILASVQESSSVISVSETNDFLLRKEMKRAMAAGDPMPEDGFESDLVRKDLSVVYVNDDEILSYLVIESTEENVYVISAALNRGGMKVFPQVLKKALDNIQNNCSEESIILIPTVNSVSAGLVRKIAPDSVQVYRYMEKVVR